MCRFVLAGLMAFAMNTAIDAAEVHARYERHVFEQADAKLPYRLLRPLQVEPGARYPLVVFLHGMGERGDDNERQLTHGLADFARDDRRTQYPCFVVAPQCPDDQMWVNLPPRAAPYTMAEQATVPMRLMMDMVASLTRELPIDPRRLYIVGLSMGGFGVWDALQRHPRTFAAAVPVCGGGDAALADRIQAVPVWVFHGARDEVVPPRRSRDMVAALKAAGGSPRYTEYPGAGHDSWTATFASDELFAWMFDQRLP
jgi:predicted peptidase